MKPDAYIPLYGDELNSAVKGYPSFVKWAYWTAIWFYWSHNHCKGLTDDDNFLRGICELDKDEWQTARDIIFDNDHFFTQDANGLWHQKRAQEEWSKSLAKYNKQVAKSKKGAKARWTPPPRRNATGNATGIR